VVAREPRLANAGAMGPQSHHPHGVELACEKPRGTIYEIAGRAPNGVLTA
jgi:hypothetical protein